MRPLAPHTRTRSLFALTCLAPIFFAALVLDERGKVGPAEGCSGAGQQHCTYDGWDDATLPREGLVPTDARLYLALSANGSCGWGPSPGGSGGAAAAPPTVRLFDAAGNEVKATLSEPIPTTPADTSNPFPGTTQQYAIIPDAPLSPDSNYELRVEGLRGTSNKTLSFKTDTGPTPPPTALLEAQSSTSQRSKSEICCPQKGVGPCGPPTTERCSPLVAEETGLLFAKADFGAHPYALADTTVTIEMMPPGGAATDAGPYPQVSGFEMPAGTYCFVAIATDNVTKLEGRSEPTCLELSTEITTQKRCDEIEQFIKGCVSASPTGAGGASLSEKQRSEIDATCHGDGGAGGAATGAGGSGATSAAGGSAQASAGMAGATPDSQPASGGPQAGSAGATAASSPQAEPATVPSSDSSGGCSMTPRPAPSHLTAVLTLLAAALFARRRR